MVAVCDATNPQRWAQNDLDGGKYQLINQETGGCMDAAGAYVSGTPVDTWFCGPISNEVWNDGPPSTTYPWYSQVRISAKPTLCLTPNGYFGQVGAPVILSTCGNQDRRQLWFIG